MRKRCERLSGRLPDYPELMVLDWQHPAFRFRPANYESPRVQWTVSSPGSGCCWALM